MPRVPECRLVGATETAAARRPELGSASTSKHVLGGFQRGFLRRRRDILILGPRTVYGKLTNRSRKSVAFAAAPSIGVTPKISSTVRSVEL